MVLKARHLATVTMAAALLVLSVPALRPVDGQGGEIERIRWTRAESPVLLENLTEIGGGTELVIEAGVVVRFGEGARLDVKGRLVVEGNETGRVLFTSNTSGEVGPELWEEVRLHQGSAGLLHQVRWAVFEGADTALMANSVDAVVEDCEFRDNRYGVMARGDANVEVRRCEFVNNTVLGLEWEAGAGGRAEDCVFSDNVVGVYCYEGSSPWIGDCEFDGNYHHLSFAQDANATVVRCTLTGATGEHFECYWNSSPVLIDVAIDAEDERVNVFLRNGSRPRMFKGTPASNLQVVVTDDASYVVALTNITAHVTSDEGGDLVDANVTITGASGDVLWRGRTGEGGTTGRAYMSHYTVGGERGNDRENPHAVTVEWGGHEQTFFVDPRDLTKDQVLELEMAIRSPEPGGWGWLPGVLLVLIIAGIAVGALWYARRTR